MPYVTEDIRNELEPTILALAKRLRVKVDLKGRDGAVNYVITRLVQLTMCNVDRSWNYEHIERAVGVLECAKLELYRRLAAPYEDMKAVLNGDVY